MDKAKELLTIYLQNPCRTLPNAFWKTAINMDNSRLSVRKDFTGALTSLALWQESRLMGFWCADPENHPLTPRQIAETPFALVHSDALSVFDQREFKQQESYFRIIHNGAPQRPNCPPGFVFENVKPQAEVEDVVRLIHACYRNMNINRKIVQDWLKHPVYDPNLWVWITDVETGERAGLGIAEIDRCVPEASLEWVQVLPGYQKRGLGKALVTQLLHRIPGDVAFVTVSGKVNNTPAVERLYRGCGFTGSDIWWLLFP